MEHTLTNSRREGEVGGGQHGDCDSSVAVTSEVKESSRQIEGEEAAVEKVIAANLIFLRGGGGGGQRRKGNLLWQLNSPDSEPKVTDGHSAWLDTESPLSLATKGRSGKEVIQARELFYYYYYLLWFIIWSERLEIKYRFKKRAQVILKAVWKTIQLS